MKVINLILKFKNLFNKGRGKNVAPKLPLSKDAFCKALEVMLDVYENDNEPGMTTATLAAIRNIKTYSDPKVHIEIENEIIERWIDEDIEFINKSLGVNGNHLIINENKKYLDESKESRIQLMRNLFMLIINNV